MNCPRCRAENPASALSQKFDPRTYQPRGMRPVLAHCHLGLGKLSRRTGKRQDAQEHLTTATTMYREMGMMYWLEKAETELVPTSG